MPRASNACTLARQHVVAFGDVTPTYANPFAITGADNKQKRAPGSHAAAPIHSGRQVRGDPEQPVLPLASNATNWRVVATSTRSRTTATYDSLVPPVAPVHSGLHVFGDPEQ